MVSIRDCNGAYCCLRLPGWLSARADERLRERLIQVLFTPKKYGRDWTQFLAVSFCTGSLVFTLFAISSAWMAYDNLLDKIFWVLAEILGAIVFGALGADQWKAASKMRADEGRKH